MDICRDLDENLHNILQQLRNIHEALDQLKNTRIDLSNIEFLQEIDEVKDLFRVLRINGKIACEKFESRIEFLNEEEPDR